MSDQRDMNRSMLHATGIAVPAMTAAAPHLVTLLLFGCGIMLLVLLLGTGVGLFRLVVSSDVRHEYRVMFAYESLKDANGELLEQNKDRVAMIIPPELRGLVTAPTPSLPGLMLNKNDICKQIFSIGAVQGRAKPINSEGMRKQYLRYISRRRQDVHARYVEYIVEQRTILKDPTYKSWVRPGPPDLRDLSELRGRRRDKLDDEIKSEVQRLLTNDYKGQLEARLKMALAEQSFLIWLNPWKTFRAAFAAGFLIGDAPEAPSCRGMLRK